MRAAYFVLACLAAVGLLAGMIGCGNTAVPPYRESDEPTMYSTGGDMPDPGIENFSDSAFEGSATTQPSDDSGSGYGGQVP